MEDNSKSAIWEAGEIIYEAGSLPKEAYLILEGYVNIETKDGLKPVSYTHLRAHET